MVLAENQKRNESYTFKDILLQPEKSYFILSIINEVEEHEAISHWILMKKMKSIISTTIKMVSSRLFYLSDIPSSRYSHMKD